VQRLCRGLAAWFLAHANGRYALERALGQAGITRHGGVPASCTPREPRRQNEGVSGADAGPGSDLWLCVAIFAAALLYYFLFLRPRSDRYWKVPGTVADPEPAAAADTGEQ